MTSREDATNAAVIRLRSAGVPDPLGDARALLATISAAPELDDSSEGRFARLVRRRCDREPLGRLIGTTSLRGVDFAVGPGVFLPQPETGAVVEWVVAEVGRRGWRAPLVVDLCTGAGTLALCLAHELVGARTYAVEQDAAAYQWGQRNSGIRAALGDSPVDLRLADAADALPDLNGVVDVVVSNPPYVADHEAHIPDREVTDHDPGVALWAGHDGLDVVRTVERTARRLLRPGGLLAIEHSDRQGVSAPELLAGTGAWRDVVDHRDDDGHDRFVTATRLRSPTPAGPLGPAD